MITIDLLYKRWRIPKIAYEFQVEFPGIALYGIAYFPVLQKDLVKI